MLRVLKDLEEAVQCVGGLEEVQTGGIQADGTKCTRDTSKSIGCGNYARRKRGALGSDDRIEP
jgi:hypothetical protein